MLTQQSYSFGCQILAILFIHHHDKKYHLCRFALNQPLSHYPHISMRIIPMCFRKGFVYRKRSDIFFNNFVLKHKLVKSIFRRVHCFVLLIIRTPNVLGLMRIFILANSIIMSATKTLALAGNFTVVVSSATLITTIKISKLKIEDGEILYILLT